MMEKQGASTKKWRTLCRLAGFSALALAMLSSLVALTLRDAFIPTAIVFFGVPWFLRLMLVVAAWFLLDHRSKLLKTAHLVVAIHCLVQANESFRWRNPEPPSNHGFEVTLWNAGRNVRKMPREWRELAGPRTRLIVLIESGSFPDDTWNHFTATHPDFTWKRLDGGIVLGVKGKILESTSLGNRPQFRCHRVRVEIDGTEYPVLAVDIPSQPWYPRNPYLDRILDSAAAEKCLILGDFNTPPDARGFDAWRGKYNLANDSLPFGFRETWCYAFPVLTLDQLWLSPDIKAVTASSEVSLRSDHQRMKFFVEPAK